MFLTGKIIIKMSVVHQNCTDAFLLYSVIQIKFNFNNFIYDTLDDNL